MSHSLYVNTEKNMQYKCEHSAELIYVFRHLATYCLLVTNDSGASASEGLQSHIIVLQLPGAHSIQKRVKSGNVI